MALRVQGACAARRGAARNRSAAGSTVQCRGGRRGKARLDLGPRSREAEVRSLGPCPGPRARRESSFRLLDAGAASPGRRRVPAERWGLSRKPGSYPKAGTRLGARPLGLAPRSPTGFPTLFVPARPFLQSEPGMKYTTAWNEGNKGWRRLKGMVGVIQRLRVLGSSVCKPTRELEGSLKLQWELQCRLSSAFTQTGAPAAGDGFHCLPQWVRTRCYVSV